MQDLEERAGRAMDFAWTAPDDEAFAYGMTTLCRALWGDLRPDPFPEDDRMVELCNHLIGINRNDGSELIRRLLSFDPDDRKGLMQ